MSVNAPNEQLDLIAPDFELLSVDNNKLKGAGFEMKYPKSIDAIKKAVGEILE